jgi:hypothetical protein
MKRWTCNSTTNINKKTQIVVIFYTKNLKKTHSIEKIVHPYLLKTTPVPSICCDQNSCVLCSNNSSFCLFFSNSFHGFYFRTLFDFYSFILFSSSYFFSILFSLQDHGLKSYLYYIYHSSYNEVQQSVPTRISPTEYFLWKKSICKQNKQKNNHRILKFWRISVQLIFQQDA